MKHRVLLVCLAGLLAACTPPASGSQPISVGPLAFSAQVGHSATVAFTLPSSAQTTPFAISGQPDWLALNPSSGSLGPAGPVHVTATATCGDTPGTQSARLHVSSGPALAIADIAVTLSCTAAPGLPSADPFSFTAVLDAAPGSSVTSNAVTLSGLSGPSEVAVAGGTLLLNGVPVSAPHAVQNGDALQLRVQASSTPGATVTASATVGTTSGVFSVTTVAAPTPNPPPPGPPPPPPPPVHPLNVSPDHLDFTDTAAASAQTLTVTRADETASITPGAACAGVVSVTPGSGAAPSASFTVRPLAAGRCTLTFTSGDQHADVPITVTTTSVGVN